MSQKTVKRHSWEPRTQPAVRRAVRKTPCPYCGEQTLIISYGDIREDDVQIQLYCKNSECAAREISHNSP